jgi:tRNA modification GTPase
MRALVSDQNFTPEPNRSYVKKIRRGSGDDLDQVLVNYFQQPHSFTGEDMVEISCHGSPLILRHVLDLTLSRDARLAGPGEFTLRACQNGKLNLSQAEAIRDLINAQTDAAAAQAARQLNGELSRALQPAKEVLIEVIAKLESALEFVEDDLPTLELEEINKQLAEVLANIRYLVGTYSVGHLLRDGLRVVIVGRPNVGKSSLFNGLLRSERAIVTEIAGTTRDSITESISIKGVPIILTDTAGIRRAGDKIEAIGVERAHQAMADADLLVVVIDGSVGLLADDVSVLFQAKERTHVVAINKSDLRRAPGLDDQVAGLSRVVRTSAVTAEGLKDLSAAILAPFGEVDSVNEGLLITDSRHHDLLRRTQLELEASISALDERASEEIVLVGLLNGLRYLGEITGETTPDDILSKIFSTFCIGK